MGKKMREKDGHKRENSQIEEGNAVKETDVLDVSKSSNIDGDKNKMEADNNEKKDRIKKRKAEFDTDKKVDQNAEDDNGRKKKKSKSEKNVSEIETLEHSKMQEPVEAQKICSPEDIDKTVHGKEEAYEKRKKTKKQKLIADENGTGKENSAGNEIEHRKLGDVVGDAEDSNVCKKKKSKSVKNDSETKTLGHNKMQEPVEAQKICSPEDINKTVHGKEVAYEKRKKKKGKKQNLEKLNGNVADDIAVIHSIADENGTGKENSAGNGTECRKLGDISGDAEEDGNGCKKKKAKSVENDSETKTPELSKMQEPVDAQKICSPEDINKMIHGKEEAYEKPKKKKEKKQKLENLNDNVADEYGRDAEDGSGCKKKKSKSVKNDSEGGHHKGDTRTKSVKTTEQAENAMPKEKSKKVSFSNQVEVFPSTVDKVGGKWNSKERRGLVYGKRFSKEEDEIVMNAVAEYIEKHNLGEDGLNMVMNCKDYKEVRYCWVEIQASIPWRPIHSVYDRAHNLYERSDNRRWTPEELEIIRKFVNEHGPNWRLLGDSLGKHRRHVKDTWRRIKLQNCNKGHWSQEEYQTLFDLVNMDFSMKVGEEKISKHGMLRDNIRWTAISDRMQTRQIYSCCKKWYSQVTSPMVAEGVWADSDDCFMLDALSSLDACCMEDVDWDNLLENRSGDLCRKRWSQMVQHLGPNKDSSFSEQVEILAKRYRPDMADARLTFERKIPIDLPEEQNSD